VNWITNHYDRRLEIAKVDENFQPSCMMDYAITQYIKDPRPQVKIGWIYTLIDLLLAAVDTSSTTVTWNLVGSARHPEVTARLHEEMDRVLPNRRPPTFDDMKDMHYTLAFINECHRFYPIVLLALPRVVTGADGEVQIQGYDIPQNTTIYINYWNLLKHAPEWVNPELFSPERFLTEDGTFTDNGLNIFGQGPRNCVGESMGRVEIFKFTVSLLQNYIFELPEDWTYSFGGGGLNLRPKGNTLKMKISPRVERA